MQYDDWGERSPRWRCIRSATIDVDGTSVHFLHAGSGTAPPQLLLHGMAGSSTMWLDVIRPLSAFGPVVAPDMPGTVIGHTVTRHARDARVERNAQFLRDLINALGLDRVVVHGVSLGGLAAVRLAALVPERVERLVLTNPVLPGPLTLGQRLGWQTLGRLALTVGPAVVRGLVRLWGPRLIDTKLAYLADPEKRSAGTAAMAGGDPSRIAPEHVALAIEQMGDLRRRPKQLGHAVTAWASAASAMFVTRRASLAAIDQVRAPVLLLWGDQDPLIKRTAIDFLVSRRPEWTLHVFETAGHAVPLELPEAYVQQVGRWLTEHRAEPGSPPQTVG